jgi:hypothetical protein
MGPSTTHNNSRACQTTIYRNAATIWSAPSAVDLLFIGRKHKMGGMPALVHALMPVTAA